jgi:hypothetical protein
MKRVLSEIEIQTVFRSRCRILCPGVSVVAVVNAAKRTQWAAMQAKREGLATGFPDVMALAPNGKAAFLEFKSATGRLSLAQVEWLARLGDMGFPCGVFRDADAAIEFLREHGFPFIGRRAA